MGEFVVLLELQVALRRRGPRDALQAIRAVHAAPVDAVALDGARLWTLCGRDTEPMACLPWQPKALDPCWYPPRFGPYACPDCSQALKRPTR